MDYKFLDKVVGQIVSETFTFEERGHTFINYPFINYTGVSSNLNIPMVGLSKHCENIYGLNGDEIMYVQKEYEKIIKRKF